VLQQQKATLEWRIADAEKKEVAGKSNPYDAPTDKAALQRMLAQVRAAIAARQAVALRAGAEASGAPPSTPAPKSSASAALQTEWQRLLEGWSKRSSRHLLPRERRWGLPFASCSGQRCRSGRSNPTRA